MSESSPVPRQLFCAFLDIMGFKQLMQDWDAAVDHYRRFMMGLGPAIFDLHTRIDQAVRKSDLPDQPPARFLRHSFISDSIIIRAEDSYDILRIVTDISQYFLERGCLIRGGIGFGNHFEDARDDNFFVVSDALVQAYLLESQTAKYPRVVFSEAAFKAFLDQKGTVQWPGQPWSKVHLTHMWASHIIQCEDDCWCLDPLFWRHGEEIQQMFRKQITTWLATYKDKAPYEKYVWLADLWNHVNYGPRWLRDALGLQRLTIDTGAAEERDFILMSVMKTGFNNPIYAQSFAQNKEIYERILRS